MADQGRDLLEQDEFSAASEVLEEAEALWRGPLLGDLADLDALLGHAARLDERRLTATEDRIAAALELGRHSSVIGELRSLVGEHPLRERLRELLSLALYRSGRQAEALRELADAGRTLREELGIEPGRPLRDLEAAILAQDPSLDRPGRSATTATPPPTAPNDELETAPVPPPPAGSTPIPEPAAGEGFVGRDRELGELLAALEESRRDARFVVIEGEPGIGKTRLAEELRLAAAARGALTAWGRSDEGAAPAMWPWLAPLRAVASALDQVPSELADLLSGESVPTASAAGQATVLQFERFEAVAAVLGRITAHRSVVVLLDDLQWADAASLELLSYLAARAPAGLLVVGTVRQLEVGRNDAVTEALAALARRSGSRRLVLRGLEVGATARMLAVATNREVAPSTAAAVHRRAEGNPFYAIELARLLDEEGAVGEVPSSVGDVIRRRLAHLPEGTVDLLRVGAVVGRDVDLGLLARSVDRPLDQVLDELEPAVVHRLLVEVPDNPSTLRFSHALVREVLLDDLTSLRRARLHLRVADAIEAAGAGIDDIEILAEHLWRAAPVGVGHRAAEALERASEVAIRRVAYGAAEDLLSKAAQLRRANSTTPEDELAELLTVCRLLEVARARRYFQAAAGLDVLARAKDLAERCGRTDLLLDLLWFEWSTYATSARVKEAAQLVGMYVDAARRHENRTIHGRGEQVLGVLAWLEGRVTDALHHLSAGRETAKAGPPPEDPFAMEVILVMETFWLFMSGVSGAMTAAEVAAGFDAMLDTTDDRFARSSICGFGGTSAVALGDWPEVERFARLGSEADPGSQFAFWGGQALMHRGIAAAWRGRIDEALASYTEGRDRYLSIGGRSAMPTFGASIAMLLAEQGAVEAAVPLLEEAWEILDDRGERWNEPILLMAEGLLAHLNGDPAGRDEHLQRAGEVARSQGSFALASRAQELGERLQSQSDSAKRA